MIDTRVNSDWAKTIIVTFVLKIISSIEQKCVHDHVHTRGFIRVNVERIKFTDLYSSVASGCNPEK